MCPQRGIYLRGDIHNLSLMLAERIGSVVECYTWVEESLV